ncbi:hypothetical protein OAO01_08180, partial [Oligoflexia bacterium]|nr:hypothetical protein [Oligoflexia bacterium]
LRGKVPIDPQGKVDVFFFFRPKDVRSLQMGSEAQALFKRAQQDKRINFIGYTFDNVTDSSIAAYRQKTGVTFPVLNGQLLAARMELKVSPTTIVIAQSTGKSVVQEGIRPFYYLDELVAAMQNRSN